MTPRVTLTIVAFDLSLRSSGVADRNGTRRIQPQSTGVERLVEVRDEVVRECWVEVGEVNGRISTVPVDLVVIEGYSYASGNQAHQVGELGGVVRLALHEAGIRYEVVSPATIKIAACGAGNASKADVLLAAVRRLGYEGNNTDEADSLWLYHLAMIALGCPQVTLPAAHMRALKALPWAVATVGAA